MKNRNFVALASLLAVFLVIALNSFLWFRSAADQTRDPPRRICSSSSGSRIRKISPRWARRVRFFVARMGESKKRDRYDNRRFWIVSTKGHPDGDKPAPASLPGPRDGNPRLVALTARTIAFHSLRRKRTASPQPLSKIWLPVSRRRRGRNR